MITARRIKMITVISGDSSMTSSGIAAEKKKTTELVTSKSPHPSEVKLN